MATETYYHMVSRQDEWYSLMFSFLTGALYERMWIDFCFIHLFSQDIRTLEYKISDCLLSQESMICTLLIPEWNHSYVLF